MAATLHSDVYDSGLSVLTAATATLYINYTQQPTTRTEAVTTYACGTKASPTIGSPTNHTTGRKVVVSAITGGTVSATQTAGWFSIVDATRLLAAGPLSATQAVTSGNTFSLGAIDIAIPAPV